MLDAKKIVGGVLGLAVSSMVVVSGVQYAHKPLGMLLVMNDGKKVYLPDACSCGLNTQTGFEFARDKNGYAFINLNSKTFKSIENCKAVPTDAMVITEAECEQYDHEQKQKSLTHRKK